MKRKYNYTLEGSQETYQVFNTEGRLLMYFKIEQICEDKQFDYFFIESNIDFDFINDGLVNYCLSKLQNNILDKKSIEFYLRKMIERILLNEFGKKMFIDSYFLNDLGKFIPSLYNVYQQIKNNIDFENYVKIGVPYTIDSDPMLLKMLNAPKVYEGFKPKMDEITKEIFEKNIPNEQVAFAYVDLYHSEASFFKIRDNEDGKTTYIFIVENRMILFFELV